MLRFLVTLLGASLGCSAAPNSPAAVGNAESPKASTPAHPDSSPAPGATSTEAPPPAPRPRRALPFSFTRVEAPAVYSLAVGKPPKVALLAQGEARIFDGSRWTHVPVPEAQMPELTADIFFGRDDQPRLMGSRLSRSHPNGETYYRRYRGGHFRPEPSELGPLAGSDGALYGVLGHADPEVVCRPGKFCLVKRTTGWGRAPAHAEPVKILLAGGTAWALHRARIERLERDAWVALTPERAWDTPISLFVDADGSPWVVEAKRDAVTRLAQGRWETLASPFQGPRAVWGTTPNDVWLVGVRGAAHFDGASWQEADGVTGPLELILYSPPDLWLAGEGGVYRGIPAAR